jgi:hypothetical protein
MDNLTQVISELDQVVGIKSADLASKDLYYFLTQLCYTMDEHDTTGNPFHLIPEKEYIRDLCDLFQTENLLAIEKSRQMMVSWWAMGVALWYTMFHPGKRTFIMSKKEKDADAMIERIKVMYERLPADLRARYPADKPFTYNTIKFGKTNSVIQGVPQGPDQVRQYTASLIIMDEAAFQEAAEKTYAALKPALMGGGKLIVISTSNGRNWFYRVVRDQF